MEKIEKGHPFSQSADIVQENLETLKRLFPTIVKEGKIDVEELKALLDEEVETKEEYYRFSWAGKSEARREANKPSTATLRPNKEESKNWDTTGNIFIEGDNLEVLKLMQKSYAGKIKMMYFDPPYNTGNDFVYKDDYSDNLSNYLALTGQTDEKGKKLNTNPESDGRYHSNWLNMMYPRLKLARNLLTEDGVVFISIDDNEVCNLRKICEEIFGEENFIAQLIWKRRVSSAMANNSVSVDHDYVICFQNGNLSGFNGFQKDFKRYLNPDNDPRGSWISDNLTVGMNASMRPNQAYDLIDPKTGIIYPFNPNRVWAFIPESMQKMIDEERIIFPDDKSRRPMQKRFMNELKSSQNPFSSLMIDRVGLNTEATRTIQETLGGNIFDYSKPLSLLKTLIGQVDFSENDIILDFYAGSGTTAHAVMLQNADDGGNRKFICVQLPEPTDEKSAAFQAGYMNIADICKERIRRAGVKILSEKTAELEKIKKTIEGKILQEETQGQIDNLQIIINNLDLGFKAFKLDSSNINAWDGSVDNFEQNLFNAQNNIKENRTEEDVLFEILLKYGLDLTIPIEEKEIYPCKVFSIGGGVLFVCLSDNITTEVADAIGKWKEEIQPATCRVLFKDNGFKDDVAKTNSIQILRQYGIEEANSI